MDQRQDGGRRPLLDKRVALVVLAVGAVLFGVGFGAFAPNQSGPTQYAATEGPDGATAAISASAGETASVDFTETSIGGDGDTSLRSLNVTFAGEGDLNLTRVSQETSTTVADAPTNNTVNYLNVTHEGDAELDSVTFTFTVQKSVIAAAAASPGDVTLHRFHDGSWQVLETSIRSEDADSYTFAAVSPGLSVFAISLSPAEPASDTATKTPTPTETATPTATERPTQTATSNGTATPTAAPNGTAAATDDPDPPTASPPDPPARATLALTSAAADPIATDTGDVDAVTGTVDGTLAVGDREATRAVLTVTVDSPDSGEHTVRQVSVDLGGRASVSLADALGDDSLLFATGARANEYTVETDGDRRQYSQTVTVSVTLYDGSISLATLTETTDLGVTVQNLDSDGGVDGESNPTAD